MTYTSTLKGQIKESKGNQKKKQKEGDNERKLEINMQKADNGKN